MMNKKLILITLVALSMNLVSCGGGGGGDVDDSPQQSTQDNLTAPLITSSASFSALENQTTIATATATDVNSSYIIFSLAGVDSNAISINSTSGVMTFNTAPDFETKNSYSVILNASDGALSSTQDVTITITDISPIITTTSLTVVENTINAGSIVASLDPASDPGATLSYGISGIDAASFDISASTGAIIFKSPPDYEVKNTYAIIVSVFDGKETTNKDINIDVTNYALVYAAKEKLISTVESNKPVTNPSENFCIVGLDVPASMKTFCEEVYSLVHATLGGYPNYLHVIWNDAGTQENAQPVLTKINGLKTALILSDLSQSCLDGENGGTERTASTDPYSVCYETMAWTADPFNSGGTDFQKHIRLALHYAHEYFHHYQRAHALERGLDLQTDRDNPTTTVQSPRWWVESAAVTFQNAWFKKYFNQLDVFKDSVWDDVKGVTIASHADANQFKKVRRAITGAGGTKDLNCTTSWNLTSLVDTELPECSGWTLVVPFLAYKTSYKTVWVDIPMNYYDLGFFATLEKFYGKSKSDFYNDFNTFLRSGDSEDDPPIGWAPSDTEIATADFLNITPEPL